GRVRPPLVLGHEFCGEVAELGPGVDTLSVGDYVSAESHVVCGTCLQCSTGQAHVCRNTRILGVDRDGCFAEYVVIPAANAWRNPPGLPVDVASMQEPLGNAVHTALHFPLVARTVAVVGCGPIGLAAVGIARAAGAARVLAAEVNPYRQALAARMGAHRVIDPSREDLAEALLAETGGLGVDVLLEMSGHPDAIRAGLRGTRSGGEAALLGLPSAPLELDLGGEVVMRGLTLQGITGRRLWQTWYQMRALLDSGVLDVTPVITHRLPLEEFRLGMELMARGECGKVVLYPGGVPS
ncbi:MAG: L-threonine 3-dehydrogenase, partial [Bacillota bacterium]